VSIDERARALLNRGGARRERADGAGGDRVPWKEVVTMSGARIG
jgi:hypothetical protein